MNFDIKNIPFSRRGSWLSFSFISGDFAVRTGYEGLFLRTVRDCGVSKEIFHLEMLINNSPAQFEIEASPEILRLKSGSGLIEIAIPEPDTIRFRGEGAELRLTAQTTSEFETFFPVNEDHWVFNSFGSATSMLIYPVEGSLLVDAPWSEKHIEHLVLKCVAPTRDTHFEIVLQEFKTGFNLPESSPIPFAECVQNVKIDFERFMKKLPIIPADYAYEKELAAYIDWSCLVNPDGLINRPTMLMSKNWMTNVWSWDHCFNALALCKKNPELAWDQFMIFFDHQDLLGAIPDSLNVSTKVWNFAKPPIHGWALKKMIDQGSVNELKLKEVYQPLCNWTNWWFNYRDFDQDGIPQYNHGNDSGWDNGTVFKDPPPVESPDLVTFLILQMETLSFIAAKLEKKEEAKYWDERWQELMEIFLLHSVRDGHLVPLTSRTHESIKNNSLLPYLTLLLGNKLPANILWNLVDGIKNGGFITEWGIATECVTSPDYETDGYWRGPIWAPSTILLVDGLLNAGEIDLAYSIAEKFVRMIKKSGFAENFNALTGEGLRDRAYTWTSSIFLIQLMNSYLNSIVL